LSYAVPLENRFGRAWNLHKNTSGKTVAISGAGGTSMKTAAAYIRVSTDDQLEYSPDSQLEKIKEYAASNDMILPEKFIFREEEGISGKKAERRPEFMRMICTAKQKPKPFDVIIVWKFSRFARNRQDSIVYKSMLRKQFGIDVLSVTEQLGDDKTSIIVEAMIEAMDEYYSINLAEEVRRGMNEKVLRGEPVSIPAFGYTIQDKQYRIDPVTAPVVKMMFRDYVSGMGCRSIAQKLNGMEVRTQRGGLWENRTVEYVLRNPVYIGKIRWNPKRKTRRNYNDPEIIVTDGTHEPIIDRETWEKVQKRLAESKTAAKKDISSKNTGMLRGLVKCSACGSTLTPSGGGSMQCQAYAHGKCTESHSILAASLEEMVLAALDASLHDSTILITTADFPEAEEITAAVSRQIEREKLKLARAREAYESGVDSLEEYRVRKQKITERLRQLELTSSKLTQSPRSPSPAKQQNVMQLLRSPQVPSAEKNVLLRSFVQKIVFHQTPRSLEIFYYA
jgi:site-specific DNA recombinase